MDTPLPSYRQQPYPAESSTQRVRLYDRFPLRYRGVAELMFARGVLVSYETIRRWCHTCGPVIAAELRRRRPQPQDKWPLDELHITMQGQTYCLWRAMPAAWSWTSWCRNDAPRTRPRRSCAGWTRPIRTNRVSR